MPRPRRKASALVWILPDQLVQGHPALARAEERHGRANVRVVLVEARAWMRRLPYHKKRQVLILSAGRHYADELRELGYAVEIVRAEDTPSALRETVERLRPAEVLTMASTEYAVRAWQYERLSELGEASVLPSSLFLVDQFDPAPNLAPGKRLILENFYRAMRRHFGVLIEPDGEPAGGSWNFDSENRLPLPRGLPLPALPRFEPDPITRQVMEEVDASGHGVGSVDGFDLAVTRREAEEAFSDFLENRLSLFGPYEDAMSHRHGTLFHSVLSPYMNLGLLDPLKMVRAAEQRFRSGLAPINSVEGFIRQILGWREFIYWQYHRQMPGLRTANAWQAQRPLPRMYWDGQTDLRCIQQVVAKLIDTGFAHHIERLMVLCNFALLAGVDPAEVADWFLAFYVDSHEWVVYPNVIGMGLNADGGITATKPYIASAAYIRKMSDYCDGCVHDPKKRSGPGACPFNTLYWNFLLRNESTLRANPRLGPNVLGLKHLGVAERQAIMKEADAFLAGME